MKEETRGEFEGIGVSIRFDDEKNIVVYQPLADSPAAKAGVQSGDIIFKVDGVATTGMALEEVAKRIRGPRDSVVRVTVARRRENAEPQIVDYTIKRGNIPLESIKEARMLPSG
ncbi:MAG: PDZ domain-containing protein, partial [Candidatus Hydrogenedentes bacterium]|nr:PDZ domain-containing protein [Candidatus Hydrogenedentota bacterium]